MRKSYRKLWLLASALVLMLALPSLAAQPPEAAAKPAGPEIKEGTDCWHTAAGTQAVITIPQDTLGRGSKRMNNVTIKLKSLPLSVDDVKNKCGCQVDTKIEYIDPHGNVLPEKTIHAVQQRTTETTDVDTCVRRTKNAKFHGKGVAVRVDIQLVKLSLQSEQPLKAAYDHGPAKSFDVKVTESGPQDTGTMTFTPTTLGAHPKGNVRLGQLHITYDVTFTEVRPGTSTYTLHGQKLTLKNGRRPGTFAQ
jgi:hypothetical protein